MYRLTLIRLFRVGVGAEQPQSRHIGGGDRGRADLIWTQGEQLSLDPDPDAWSRDRVALVQTHPEGIGMEQT